MTKLDTSKVESICYNYIWQGKDRIKRAIIKNHTIDGGLNGIDIESFMLSSKIRSYIKAEKHFPILTKIQDSEILQEEVASIVRLTLVKLNRTLLKNSDSEELDKKNITDIGNIKLRWIVKPLTKASKIINQYKINSASSINSVGLTRGQTNLILRSVPAIIKLSLVEPLSDLNAQNQNLVLFKNKIFNLEKISGRKMQEIIKVAFNKVETDSIYRRYNILGTLLEEKAHWNNWIKIKNPILRAIRYKIAYNDIFSNQKRCKLKLSDTDACAICGEVETTFHQLFECQNARRLWDILPGIKAIGTIDKYSLLCVGGNIGIEIIKSCIFKALVQIDRSRFLPVEAIVRQIIHYLRIESITLNKLNKISESTKFDMLRDSITNYNSKLGNNN